MLPMGIDRPFHERNEVLEELGLVNDDNLVRRNVYIVEIFRVNTGSIASIMCRNKTLSVSHIGFVRNHQDGDTQCVVSRND